LREGSVILCNRLTAGLLLLTGLITKDPRGGEPEVGKSRLHPDR